MFIFHELKMIYIIVPKTGSNSFWKSLSKKYSKEEGKFAKDHPVYKMEGIKHRAHLTARQMRTIVDKETWESYEKVGFVRHPYDWVISYFNAKTGTLLGETETKSFRDFIKNIRMTPFSWFTDTNGEMLIDTVYRTEDLKEILEGYGCKSLHENKTPKGRKAKNLTAESLSDEDRRVIDKRFKREMEYYEDI